jgi:ankyrin repeat protein
MMEVLIAHGASAKQAMPSGMTALLFAVTPSRRKSAHDAVAAAKLCLDNGADVNAHDAAGATALHLAVATSDDLVKELAERGARLDAKDQLGRTPLDVALGVGGEGRGRAGGRGAAPAVRETTATLLRELAARSNAPR